MTSDHNLCYAYCMYELQSLSSSSLTLSTKLMALMLILDVLPLYTRPLLHKPEHPPRTRQPLAWPSHMLPLGSASQISGHGAAEDPVPTELLCD